MKVGDIIIRDKTRRTELKYRIIRTEKIGGLPILWGYRVKLDERLNEWISFGQERALLERDFRLLTDEDFKYF